LPYSEGEHEKGGKEPVLEAEAGLGEFGGGGGGGGSTNCIPTLLKKNGGGIYKKEGVPKVAAKLAIEVEVGIETPC